MYKSIITEDFSVNKDIPNKKALDKMQRGLLCSFSSLAIKEGPVGAKWRQGHLQY